MLTWEGAVAATGSSGSCLCRVLGSSNSSMPEGSDGHSMSVGWGSCGLPVDCSKGPTAEAMLARDWDMARISWVMDTKCLFALC